MAFVHQRPWAVKPGHLSLVCINDLTYTSARSLFRLESHGKDATTKIIHTWKSMEKSTIELQVAKVSTKSQEHWLCGFWLINVEPNDYYGYRKGLTLVWTQSWLGLTPPLSSWGSGSWSWLGLGLVAHDYEPLSQESCVIVVPWEHWMFGPNVALIFSSPLSIGLEWLHWVYLGLRP